MFVVILVWNPDLRKDKADWIAVELGFKDNLVDTTLKDGVENSTSLGKRYKKTDTFSLP